MKKSLCIIFLFIGISLSAQDIAIKTNLLYDISTTINLGAEFRLAPKWTLDLSANYNPFTFSDSKKWKHWMVQPEARYWLCEAFNGHFLGLHSGYAFYNAGGVRFPFQDKSTRDYRYQGWATGVGFSYGYSWILGKRWNLEATLGFGYIYSSYDKYECATCGDFKNSDKKHYFSPTKAGISIIYMID